jgi:hypothetical protein
LVDVIGKGFDAGVRLTETISPDMIAVPIISRMRSFVYRRHRFAAEVIAQAVWLNLCFPLSLRMVADLLAALGIIVSHQTVRLWVDKFGRHFAGEIRRRSAGRLGTFYLTRGLM